ncbi:MAG: ATP-binding protein, partial [Candidatus Limnocylindria bacterium]
AATLGGADAAALLLVDESGEALRVRAHVGLPELYARERRMPLSRVRELYRGPAEPLLIDLREQPDAREAVAAGFAKVLALPLVRDGQPVGSLTLYTRDPDRVFDEDDVETAAVLAGHAAVVITNARLYADAVAGRELQRALLESLGDGVVIVLPGGTLAGLNPAAREILGVDALPDTAAALRAAVALRDAETGEPTTEATSIVARALRGDPARGVFTATNARTGEQRTVEAVATPVRRPDRRLVGAVIAMHDVSTQRQLAREKDEFLSIVSHELKTPLTPLKALAQLLRLRLARARGQGEPLDLDSFHRNLLTIERQVDRLNGLVNDLLEVSRAGRGRFELSRAPFDLAQLVRDVAQRYVDATAEEGRHRFDVAAPEACEIDGDEARIEQVLMNLVGNAVKYSPRGGTVKLRLAVVDGRAAIEIRDEGIGIAPDDLPRLGRAFARGAGRASTYAGVGIGLYLSRLVAEGHGGSLEVESEGEDRGTTVRVVVPLR